jgi:chromosome segregation ATPase
MSTPAVYTPSEPTGPPPAHLANEEDDDELVRILKAHANLLTTRGRLTVDSEIQEANNQIKHIINILMQRCKAKHEELGITKDLLAFAQGKINAFDETFTNLEHQLVIIRAANDNFRDANHNLQRDYDTVDELRRRAIGERNQARHERNVLQADYTQAVRDRNEAQNAVNRGNILLNHWRLRATRTGGQLVLANAQIGQVNAQLVHANNRVRFGIQTLGRLRNRLFQQIAALRIQVQWFRIRQLNPPPPPLNNPQNTTWLLLH